MHDAALYSASEALTQGALQGNGSKVSRDLSGLIGLGYAAIRRASRLASEFSRLQGTSKCTAGGFPRSASRHPVAPFPWEQPYLKFAVSNY